MMEKTDATTEKPKRKTAAGSTATPGAEPKKRTRKRTEINAEMRHRMISDAAYFRAEKHANGADDVANWLAAEAEIDSMLGKSGLSS